MKMADLPGRVYSPIMGQEARLTNDRDKALARQMKKGQQMRIDNPRIVLNLNRMIGPGTFSSRTVNGVTYLIRNK